MKKQKIPNKKVIALAGNPNVGKSTVFNALTGMHQHTGNWTGKTVDSAEGRFLYKEREYVLVDLPGTYSLCSHSEEEENESESLDEKEEIDGDLSPVVADELVHSSKDQGKEQNCERHFPEQS